MRTTVLTGMLLFVSLQLFAQKTLPSSIPDQLGFYGSFFGDRDFMCSETREGEASYKIEKGFVLGGIYRHPLRRGLWLESGLRYGSYNVLVEPDINPEEESSSYTGDLSMVSLPLNLKAGFLKFFYFSGGILLDMDVSNDNPVSSQTGLGGLLDVGLKYDFHSGPSVFLGQDLMVHSILPLSINSYHKKLTEISVRFGLSFPLAKTHSSIYTKPHTP